MDNGEKLFLEGMQKDIRCLDSKLDKFITTVNGRCAKRGELLAGMLEREKERDKQINRRIVITSAAIGAAATVIAATIGVLL